ncbi:auxilin-related protein 2-like [Impatiens glandulifera]|uniref:auxilin-related protein 2-like n=1 Tax=Impatiens glandulifera TaxID=253017 RepID=UPI001FB117B3|nr:auxilin-related protein 2-like [Impatiens glandulifera]
MDDFGMLARDFGFKPQGKAAPMSAPRANFADAGERRPRYDDNSRDGSMFNDVFGGLPKHTSYNNSKPASTLQDLDYDSIFKNSSSGFNDAKSDKPSSSPVYDKPVYDEDIFDGLPGLKSKSTSSSVRFDDASVFRSNSPPQGPRHQSATAFDDLLGNLGRNPKSEARNHKSSGGLDDLLSGFGVTGSAANIRSHSEFAQPPTIAKSSKETFNVLDDPFAVLQSTSKPAVSSPGLFADTLDEIGKTSSSRKEEVVSSSNSAAVFDDIDPLDSFSRTVPTFPSETSHRMKDGSPLRTGSSTTKEQASSYSESIGRSSFRGLENDSQKNMSYKSFDESHLNVFDIPTVSSDSHGSVGQTPSASYVNANDSVYHGNTSPTFEDHIGTSGKVWLTVLDFPLVTHPTIASPPSRPPPPRPEWAARSEAGFFSTSERKGTEYSSTGNSTQNSQSNVVNQVDDELDDFAMGRNRSNDNAYDMPYGEEVNTNSSAAASEAAMKEAMDKAQARFRYAKEVKEREHGRTSRSKEATQQEKDELPMQHDQEVLERQKRQKEEEEREQRRLENERVREKEQARHAVERATREARERAVAEARERAATEARIKSERAAVQRAQAEARERAAVEARERAEKAAAEARERANSEAKEKEAREKVAAARAEAEARRRAERVVVERVAAEARERAATEARERAAAARMSQQKNDNDLESFFSAGSRPSSAPRPRATADPVDSFFQSKGGPDTRKTPSVSTASSMRKASSTANIVDDLSSIFGAAPSAGEFQEVEGETDERRRARLERHQRTHERAAKALAEKNQRDLQTQREQEERHRIGETLDIEIKRWAAGKEGNLRALLSTLQYVLWPECGWQPVSLTDLIIGASVKKVYRKATLCIHPDKVQQKGATLQQKYVAEKVFDLLKEAWNKFNSEELF